MIWCPNTGSICGERITPLPQKAFLIASDRPKSQSLRPEIEKQVTSILMTYDIKTIFASTYRKGGNILCKICKLIQQVQLGVLIYDSKVEKRTIPNLFYEVSLMHYLGKELIMIGHKTSRPSDLESIEWIRYEDEQQFKKDVEERLKRILEMKNYYESVADIEIRAGNYLAAIEYLKKSILIRPEQSIVERLGDTNERIKAIGPLQHDYQNNCHFINTVQSSRFPENSCPL